MNEMEEEVRDALESVRLGHDFIMTGGAGSGKTHSMLRFLQEVYASDPRASVACVTFTNVAVNEIRSRFPFPGLHVSTIHEFLWNLIRRFQKNIRSTLADLVNNGRIKSGLDLPVSPSFWNGSVKYAEWLSLQNGEISHDEVLKIAEGLFRAHPTLSRILSDQYDFLLIDEYQDTPLEVLKIVLESLPQPSCRNLRVGLFGDGEQAIHEGGKGKSIIENAVQNGRLVEIKKFENRRNPAAVLRVINALRTDGLEQFQSTDPGSPNFGDEGSAKFLFTTEQELDVDGLKRTPFCRDWEFSSGETKLLYLSKSMIARQGNFPQLMAIYDKDRVVDYAKRVRSYLSKNDLLVDKGVLFGQVLEQFGTSVPPTPTQKAEFERSPALLATASKFTFEDIVNTSSNSDRLLGTKKVSSFDERERGEKRDPLINHLMAIEKLRRWFADRKFNSIIRSVDMKLDSIPDREKLAADLRRLVELGSSSIDDVISFAEESGVLKRRDAIIEFQQRHPYRCARVMEAPYSEIEYLYDYVEDHSPFSTQHGVKGSEWTNVFVSLDNGGWNNYNFGKLMSAPESNDSVVARSRMMLYVTTSRARRNLLVYVHRPSQTTLERAREWFGEENVSAIS